MIPSGQNISHCTTDKLSVHVWNHDLIWWQNKIDTQKHFHKTTITSSWTLRKTKIPVTMVKAQMPSDPNQKSRTRDNDQGRGGVIGKLVGQVRETHTDVHIEPGNTFWDIYPLLNYSVHESGNCWHCYVLAVCVTPVFTNEKERQFCSHDTINNAYIWTKLNVLPRVFRTHNFTQGKSLIFSEIQNFLLWCLWPSIHDVCVYLITGVLTKFSAQIVSSNGTLVLAFIRSQNDHLHND